jgi:gliding motility-associated-like protein
MKFLSLPGNTLNRKTSTRLWWARLIKFSFLLWIGLLPCKYLQAEVKDTIGKISPPVFDWVTINPETNMVTVQWLPSSTPTVAGYIIKWEKYPGDNYTAHIHNNPNSPYTATFYYPRVDSASIKFNILAYDNTGKESARTDPSHSTVFTKVQFDSCKSAVKVSWSPYYGWGKNLTGYKVFDAKTQKLLGELDSSKREFLDTTILENTEYCYYVSAIRKDSRASLSNKACITTPASFQPDYIVGDYTRYVSTNMLEIQFSADPALVNSIYSLYRAKIPGSFSKVADLLAANGTINFVDSTISLNEYNYFLVYLNGCHKEGKRSNVINNVLLKTKNEGMTNRLTWNMFSSWENGVNAVNILRSSNNGSLERIASISPNATEYSDVIDAQQKITSEVCYMVQIVSNPDNYGKVNTSGSNLFCMSMLGNIFVPNAFTPDGVGNLQNEVFKPSFSIIPEKYTLIVYNRYGAKIFESNNASEGWDGKLSNGSKALEGTYIYYIKVENGEGKVLEKRGNFNLIYP